jgi:CRISPR-associated protein Csd1
MRDKYFASAAATPATVFPLVIAHGQNHLSKARKTPNRQAGPF